MAFLNPTDNPDFVAGPGFGSGVIFNAVNQSVPSGVTYFPNNPGVAAPFYVGAAGSLVLSMVNTGSAPLTIQALFYVNPLDANAAWAASWGKALATYPTFDTIPILAPYIRFRIVTNPSGPWAFSLLAFCSPVLNLGAGLGSLTPAPGRVCAFANSMNIGNGASQNVIPSSNIPGPAQLFIASSAQPCEAFLTITGPNGNNQQFGGIQLAAGANNRDTRAMALPNEDWELSVLNTGTAAGIFAASVTSQR